MARLLKSLTRQYKAIGCGFTHAAQPSTTIIPLSNHYLLASPKFSSLLMDSNSPDFVASSSCSSTKIQLYSYWQSSCSWRVRFALNLKELPYEYKAVDLSKGEQFSSEFERLNPVHFVPVLVEGDLVVSDSFAILLYLDEKYPQNALLPVDVKKKALNLQVAGIIGSSIQPLHMQSVLNYLDNKAYPEDTLSWAQHYVIKGFTALEKLLKGSAGNYATGDEVFMADVFLAPQISVATTRFNIDMSSFPTLNRIYEAYKVLPAFQASVPERQPDAKIVLWSGDVIFAHLVQKLSKLKVQR